MANPWMRFYLSFYDNPDVQSMPENLQRRLVMLLLARGKEVPVSESKLGFDWRLSSSELQQTKSVFLGKGFIDEEWNLIGFDLWNTHADNSKERTKRYRERHNPSPPRNDPEKPVTRDVTRVVTRVEFSKERDGERNEERESTKEKEVKKEGEKEKPLPEIENHASQNENHASQNGEGEDENLLFAFSEEPSHPRKRATGKKIADPRFVECVERIDRYWKYIHGSAAKLPEGAAMGKQLNALLFKYPNMSPDDFHRVLGNRAMSENCNQMEEPAQYLPRLNLYFSGPLNKFGQPAQIEVTTDEPKGMD